MGQYHMPVNLDKKEFLYSHSLGVGLKQWEQLVNDPGLGTALQILLFSSNDRGGGDIGADGNEVIGRWAGDRIITIGDYQQDDDIGFLPQDGKPSEIWNKCQGDEDEDGREHFTDITHLVRPIIEQAFEGKYEKNSWGSHYFKYDPEGLFSDRCPKESSTEGETTGGKKI